MTTAFYAILAVLTLGAFVLGRRSGKTSKDVEVAKNAVTAEKAATESALEDHREVLEHLDSEALGSVLRGRLAKRRRVLKERSRARLVGPDDADDS